jgi:hypothetical protein
MGAGLTPGLGGGFRVGTTFDRCAIAQDIRQSRGNIFRSEIARSIAAEKVRDFHRVRRWLSRRNDDDSQQ